MANIATDYIEVFPSVQRESVSSRSFTEKNVADLIYNFIDHNKNGFVITNEYVDNDPFEFNIKGYYFKVAKGNYITVPLNSETNIWAEITIAESTLNSGYFELQGTDSGSPSSYTGVNFLSTPTGNENTYAILILSRASTSDSWSIPEDSKIRFKPSNVGLETVDGGTW